MRNVSFQKAKLSRIILVEGSNYVFTRDQLDEYGEPTGDSPPVATIRGLWHESQSYVSLKKEEASTVRSKPSPQILVMADDARSIEQGDLLFTNGKKYTVSGIHDPTNLGVAADISLEVSV